MDALDHKFDSVFGQGGEKMRFFCPGRVNLIGEHIDYLGGSVLPTVISLGITANCRKNDSKLIRVRSSDFDGTTELNLNSLPNSKTGHWSDFVLGVILHLKSKQIELIGCDILFDSDLPKASGLSSSAAMEVLNYYLFYFLSTGTEPNRVQMALNCQQIENEFIGVNCGIMDQFSVANGKQNHAIKLNCNTLEHSFVPLEFGTYSLLIINSNKPRTLTESAYNQRRAECDKALIIIKRSREIENLVDALPSDLELLDDVILKKRTRHAMSEQLRVSASCEALSQKDLIAFGKLMSESHASLRDDFEVSCTELDLIVHLLQSEPTCLGARMTGAGFGGCCIALIESNSIDGLKARINSSYTEAVGYEPSFYVGNPSSGVRLKT